MTQLQPARGTFTGRHMWLLAIAFFGVVISVNVGMAIVASTSWTGLTVDNSYVASQQFEEKRLAHEKQRAAGWQATFTYSPGIANVVIVDGGGNRVDLGAVSLHINRPVGGHDDQAVILERAADGGYRATLELGVGVWEALVTALDTPLGPFELHERFKVEAARP